MNNVDKQYLDNAKLILEQGEVRDDRTGTGTIALFSPPEMRFDLTQGFPLLTTKKLHIPSIVHELVWMIAQGNTNIKYLVDNNIKIWNGDAYRWYKSKGGTLSEEEFINNIKNDESFAKEHGDLGPIYGKQWREWLKWDSGYGQKETIDQIKGLIQSIKENPTSRRHIVSAWNVSQLEDMALPPCHILFQAYVSNDGGLSLKLYQRSADFFLGVPFNIAFYSLLTHIIAQCTGLYAKEFIHTFGDAHIYKNHVEQIQLQMTREPKPLPKLILDPNLKDIDDLTAEQIKFEGYDPHPIIRGKVSVG